MANRRGVQTERQTEDIGGWCEDCDKLPTGSTRERVRIHVQQTGHLAHYDLIDRTTYQRETSDGLR